MKKHIYGFVVVFTMAIFFNPHQASGQFFFMENEKTGKEVQDFTLKVVNGEEVRLKKYRDGKKTIIFFWATWCPHCRTELGRLNEEKASFEKQNIKIALVDVGEKEDIVDKYIRKNNITFDVFLDVESKVANMYGLIGVPTFYFVDKDGIVLDVQHSLPENLEDVFSDS